MNKKWIMRVAFFMAFVFGVCSAHAQSSKTAVPPMDEEVKQQITEISQLFKENPEKANESFLRHHGSFPRKVRRAYTSSYPSSQ